MADELGEARERRHEALGLAAFAEAVAAEEADGVGLADALDKAQQRCHEYGIGYSQRES